MLKLPAGLGADQSAAWATLPFPVRITECLNVSRDGAPITRLDNLCQGFTTLTVKTFFLLSSLILHSFNLNPFPLVLGPL